MPARVGVAALGGVSAPGGWCLLWGGMSAHRGVCSGGVPAPKGSGPRGVCGEPQ